MGLVDRRPVVCRNLAMGFWVAKEGFYLVKSVLRHHYRQGWRFLTLWEGFGVEEAAWEPFSAFVLPQGRLNPVLVDYLS